MADHGASLQTFALGAVSAIAGVDGNSPETAFLRRHWETAGGDQWPRAFQAYLDRAASNGTPLRGLGSLLGLHPVEMLTASLASAVEIDMMCGRALARVQAPVGGSRPTVGLLASAFAPANAAARSVVQTILTGAAMRCGLITLLQDGAPVAERPVAVPLPTCLALTGADAPWRIGDGVSVCLAAGDCHLFRADGVRVPPSDERSSGPPTSAPRPSAGG